MFFTVVGLDIQMDIHVKKKKKRISLNTHDQLQINCTHKCKAIHITETQKFGRKKNFLNITKD